MSDTAQSVKLDKNKMYLFYSKFISPSYDITTKEEHMAKMSFAVQFKDHHAQVSAEEAEKLVKGKHYNREYWMVKKRVPVTSISSIVNSNSATPLDANIINMARARAEHLVASQAELGVEVGKSEVEAEDAELSRIARNRAAITERVDPTAKKTSKVPKKQGPPVNKGKRVPRELIPPGEPSEHLDPPPLEPVTTEY